MEISHIIKFNYLTSNSGMSYWFIIYLLLDIQYRSIGGRDLYLNLGHLSYLSFSMHHSTIKLDNLCSFFLFQ